MARLGYLNDPERMREFLAAQTVFAVRRGWRERVYGGLELQREDREDARDWPQMEVPISGRAELQALLDDCREIKNGWIPEALKYHDEHFSPGAAR